MKINTKNYEKMNAKLDEINGNAHCHTFTGPQLRKLGLDIKKHLSQWFTLQDMKGIEGIATSGDKMPNAYKHQRVTNSVAWVVGASGTVFITEIVKDQSWNEGGMVAPRFTDDQKEIIRAKAVDSSMRF